MSALETRTASALTGEEKTIQLMPAGLFRANDGRPAGLPGWTLTASSAGAIINAATVQTNDFVIDYEHQGMYASKNGLPAPAAGWFKRLEWRDGEGLFAVDVRWTARAQEMIAAREYRYISPIFSFDPKTGVVTRLFSAAITNTPALDGLTDIAAAKRQAGGMSDHDREHANYVLRHFFGKDAPQMK